MIEEAIKRRRFWWLAGKLATYAGTHLQIDKEKKTWKLSSDRASDPDVKRDYSDCVGRKADPSKYKEIRGPKAHTIIETD